MVGVLEVMPNQSLQQAAAVTWFLRIHWLAARPPLLS
jgi:hypothetical protein